MEREPAGEGGGQRKEEERAMGVEKEREEEGGDKGMRKSVRWAGRKDGRRDVSRVRALLF